MPNHSQNQPYERLVIGITGRMGVGKTSAAKYLSETHGFQYLRYSQVLAEWLGKDSEGRTHLQETGWKVMAGGMQSELNRRLIAQISPRADVVVDGLRHPIDYESLRNSFLSSFHLLCIDSPVKSRWERLKDRGRYADLSSFEAADSHPVEQMIESLQSTAEFTFHNDSSLEDLYAIVSETIRGLKKASKA